MTWLEMSIFWAEGCLWTTVFNIHGWDAQKYQTCLQSFNLYHILGTTTCGEWKYFSFALNLPNDNYTDNVSISWDWVENTFFLSYSCSTFHNLSVLQNPCSSFSRFKRPRLRTVLVQKLLGHFSLPFSPFLYSSESKIYLWNRVNRGATDFEYNGFTVLS